MRKNSVLYFFASFLLSLREQRLLRLSVLQRGTNLLQKLVLDSGTLQFPNTLCYQDWPV